MSAEKCPEEMMINVLRLIEDGADDGLAAVEKLLGMFPQDQALHFLRGSVLASSGEYDQAQVAMKRAVEIDPDYFIARFQLGLLQLTSGDAAGAGLTWHPFGSLEADHHLRLFAEGLERLAQDDFRQAAELITQGIANNAQNEPLNRDMRMMLEEIHRRLANPDEGAEVTSSAHFLLQQSESKRTMH